MPALWREKVQVMNECEENGHPRLVHVVNLEFGGVKSTTYRCERCKDLFTVTIEPLAPIQIVLGTPKSEK
jgi:ribosomal protein L32